MSTQHIDEPLTKELLDRYLRNVKAGNSNGFLYQRYVKRIRGYAAPGNNSVDDYVKQNIDKVWIPQNSNRDILIILNGSTLLFKKDGRIYFYSNRIRDKTRANPNEDYRVYYYERPESRKDVLSKAERKEKRKKDERDEINQSFATHSALVEIIRDAKHSMKTGEPMTKSISNFVRGPPSPQEVEELSSGEVERRLGRPLKTPRYEDTGLGIRRKTRKTNKKSKKSNNKSKKTNNKSKKSKKTNNKYNKK